MAATGVETVSLPNGLTCYFTSPIMRKTGMSVVREIFEQRRYAHDGFELRPTDVVVDVGANVGLFALWAAPQVSRVVCAEPSPGGIECLKLNVEANALSNVVIVEAAIGKDGGPLDMVTYPGWELLCHADGFQQSMFMRFLTRLGRLNPDAPGRQRFSAPQVSLARLMDDHELARVDYLKIDCEGGEYETLRNMDAAHWERIEKVSMEFHEYSDTHHHRELVSILQASGFTVEVPKKMLQYRLFNTGEIWASR
jgi:FkbM family methyltransferase